MPMFRPIRMAAVFLVLAAAGPLVAWSAGAPAPPPALNESIPLYAGVAPGSEKAQQA